MTIDELLLEIQRRSVNLRRDADQLILRASRKVLEPAFITELRNHKLELLNLVGAESVWWSPPVVITPEMLPLVDLTPEEITAIVRGVPGGAGNVQDIYPLAPLQEGILFHHLMAKERDPYLLANEVSFKSREQLLKYLETLQKVIDRHDILRTAVKWEGLREPVQVVQRRVRLPVEEVELDPAAGEIAEQLYSRFDPHRYRIDVSQAPMLRCYIAQDRVENRWLLMFLQHQLIGDHTTSEMMQEEVRVHLLGQADRLPEPEPFRNLVVQARLAVNKEEHERFFRDLLGDVEEPTAPFGLLDVQGDGAGIAEARIELDSGLVRRIRERARKLGVSAASVCHLAWGQVLARMSGREDVVFGTLLFGRMQGGLGADRVMGPFINTLPVRIRIGEEGAEKSVRQVHKQLAELLRHEHASLALAQRCSAVPAPVPLFTALLNYRHSEGVTQTSEVGASRVREGIEWLRGEERSNYPLSLDVDDLGKGFVLTAQVVPSIGAQRVCAMMRKALEELVGALEATPAKAVSKLGVLPEDELRRLLYEWNETGMEFPAEKCIHELFEEQVQKNPEAVAVVYEDRQLTYGELNRRANQVGHYLRALGVEPDARVAICVERGLEMIVGLLGILKAGGAYVPLDAAYPSGRLARILAEAQPRIVLNDAAGREALGEEALRSLTVLDVQAECPPWSQCCDADMDASELGLTSHHLAYVIYTSGSAGTPKGVMIEHRAVSNQLAALKSSYGLTHLDRILQFASPTFDASIEEIFGALLNGAVLVLRTNDWLSSAYEFVKLCARYDITLTSLPVSFWSRLTDVWHETSIPRTLREVIIGGEPVSAQALHVWFDTKGHRPILVNTYGPTETTVNATLIRFNRDDGRPSIGRPIGNTQIFLLDRRSQLIPAGAVGEICIGGAGVARGYLNRPELTAERFVPAPFDSVPGERMFKTGDLARYLPDGNLEFMGRNDFQVKIRGFRIELGEIEVRLTEYPGVRQVVVIAREDTPGEKRLVAYYASGGEEAPTAEQLREHLAARLPQYMLPAAFVRLQTLPVTPSGKLDRKALPVPEGEAYVRRGYEAPHGELEYTLAALWQELLVVERVSRHDHFFELGGHSLLAVKMVTRLRRSLRAEVGIADLFMHPVLADLAQAIKNAAYVSAPSIRRATRNQRPGPFVSTAITATRSDGHKIVSEDNGRSWRDL